jgi:hypothetical protein
VEAPEVGGLTVEPSGAGFPRGASFASDVAFGWGDAALRLAHLP